MALLVNLPVVKAHLRLSSETDVTADAELTIVATQATDTILSFLKTRADPLWTPVTVPTPIQRAILATCAHFYEHRGDDPETDAAFWEAIGRQLAQFRDPALA